MAAGALDPRWGRCVGRPLGSLPVLVGLAAPTSFPSQVSARPLSTHLLLLPNSACRQGGGARRGGAGGLGAPLPAPGGRAAGQELTSTSAVLFCFVELLRCVQRFGIWPECTYRQSSRAPGHTPRKVRAEGVQALTHASRREPRGWSKVDVRAAGEEAERRAAQRGERDERSSRQGRSTSMAGRAQRAGRQTTPAAPAPRNGRSGGPRLVLGQRGALGLEARVL